MSDQGTNRPNHPLLSFFPEELNQLNLEIQKHPRLIAELAAHPAPEWEIRLAQVAQYCGIVIDGTFDAEGVAYIAGACLKKLKAMDASMITVVDEFGNEGPPAVH